MNFDRPMYWRLNDDHSVSPIEGDLKTATLEWAREFEHPKRFLAQTTVEGCLISTIFLGTDHGMPFGDSPPILFETMAFSAATKPFTFAGRTREVHEEIEQRRYATYDEAMKGHEEVVAHVRATVTQLRTLTSPAPSSSPKND